MLVFSFPRLSGFFTINNRNKMIRWLMAQRTVLRTKAVTEQIPYALRVDVDGNRIVPLALLLPSAEPSSPAAGEIPDTVTPSSGRKPLNPFACGGDLDITGVLFPEGEAITDQSVDILFSEKGYCDRAIIHVQDGDDPFSLYIEPFLPRVAVYDGYIRFGQRWEAPR
jgi:hypothetical protein